jgi:hypothetical protein
MEGKPVSRPGLECGNSITTTTTTQDCYTLGHDIWSESNVLNPSIIWRYIVYALITLSNKPDTTKNVSGNIPKHYYYLLILFLTIPCLKKMFNSHVTVYAKYTLKFPCSEMLMITMFSLQCFSKPRPVCCLCAHQDWEMLGNSGLQRNNAPAQTFLFVQQFWHMTIVPTLHKPERHLCDPPYLQKSRLYSKGKDTMS